MALYLIHVLGKPHSVSKTWKEAQSKMNGLSNSYAKKFCTSEELDNYVQEFENPLSEQSHLDSCDIAYSDGSLYEGCGYIGVYFPNDQSRNISKAVSDNYLTVPRIELRAAIEASEQLEIFGLLYVDSSYVLCVANNKHSMKWKANRDLIDQFRKKITDKQLSVKKVKSHSGIIGNDRADELCRVARRSNKSSDVFFF